MTSRDQTPLLIAAILSTVALMVYAAARGRVGMIVPPACLFVATAIMAVLLSNLPDWRSTAASPPRDVVEQALHRNARALGAAYAWSAIAMHALYLTPLTGLRWQHGWQYALAFALLAALSYEFARLVRDAGDTTRAMLVRLAVPLTIGQGVLAASGLAFLVLSGKLLSRRPDWAAHQVFLFSALAVMVLAAVTLRTHARLTEQA